MIVISKRSIPRGRVEIYDVSTGQLLRTFRKIVVTLIFWVYEVQILLDHSTWRNIPEDLNLPADEI